MDEKKCLAYDPFDDRDARVKVLDDKFVTTRKPHDCSHCFSATILAASRVRARSELDLETGQKKTFYFCRPCCEAMAIADEDEGKAIEQLARLAYEKQLERQREAT